MPSAPWPKPLELDLEHTTPAAAIHKFRRYCEEVLRDVDGKDHRAKKLIQSLCSNADKLLAKV